MKVSYIAVMLLLIAAAMMLAGCSAPSANSQNSGMITTGTPVITPVTDVSPQTTDARHTDLTVFVDRAQAYAKQYGKNASLLEFNNANGTFIKGDLYMFAYGMDGTTLAWPFRPDQIGTNRAGAADSNGVNHVRRMIEVAGDGGGYVYYVTKNPANNNREELKLSYVRPVDNTWFIGSGIYLSEVPALFNTTERDQLVERVIMAREYAQANGAVKAVRNFNDRNGTFADGSKYIFVYAYNGTTLAMPFQPETIGTNRMNFTDTNGVKITAWEIATAKSGGGFVYVDYYNPDTGKPGMKLCYVTPVDDTWLVGSGIYTGRQ
ncbi:MAG: cache domain-containing protein [Methanoregula sp.]|nr:cache domain-containing protein [Methanoregula sp.]